MKVTVRRRGNPSTDGVVIEPGYDDLLAHLRDDVGLNVASATDVRAWLDAAVRDPVAAGERSGNAWWLEVRDGRVHLEHEAGVVEPSDYSVAEYRWLLDLWEGIIRGRVRAGEYTGP